MQGNDFPKDDVLLNAHQSSNISFMCQLQNAIHPGQISLTFEKNQEFFPDHPLCNTQINNLKNSIKILLLTPNLSREALLLKISEQLNFKTEIYRDDSNIIVQGILTYSNGQCFEIMDGYRKTILLNLKKMKSIFSFKGSNLKFKAHAPYKSVNDIQSIPIYQLLETIKSSIVCLKNQLVNLGIKKCYSRLGLKLKKQKLSLLKKITSIFAQTDLQTYKYTDGSENNINDKQKQGKGCVFIDCQQIQSAEQQSWDEKQDDSQNSVRCGGYFQVQKKKYNITLKSGSGVIYEENKQLAAKSIKDQQKKQYSFIKLNRQLNIMNQIQSPQHFLKYYRPQVSGTTIYMEYAQQNLDDIIYQQQNTLYELLDISAQLVRGVEILQQSNIVHRDLKPDNILIMTNNSSQKQVKIIDFGESTLTTDIYNNNQQNLVLGSTIPYSPPETLFQSKNSFNRKQIDYWSVGMLIYEIGFRNCPITYSRSFGKDAYKSWWIPDQFSIFPLHKKKGGIRIIEFIIYLISVNSICVKQDERLSLQKTKKILQASMKFLDNLL